MSKRKVFSLFFLPCLLVAAVAFAATISASGTAPTMTQKGAQYIATLSPSGAPSYDVGAGNISWNWSVSPGVCPTLDNFNNPCPYPQGFNVRLCWHTDADGSFYPDSSVCKDVTNQRSGTTGQWSGWLFNSGAKRLRMKFVFQTAGSGTLSPYVTGQGIGVSVNY